MTSAGVAHRRWTSRPRLFAVVAITTVLAPACGRDPAPRTVRVGDTTVTARRLTAVVEGLCAAARHADDVTEARRDFFNRSHQGLHLIARALEPVDRPAAARLLEAKERVEADLAGTATPRLRSDLDQLVTVARRGLERLKVHIKPCAS